METLSVREARRLALARAGLLQPERSGLPRRAGSGERRARAAAQAVVERFGYLQLDTVSIAGARSHAIVLLSRLDGFPAELGEGLLRPGAPLFEYWGHEVCWLPLDLYPAFEFRRRLGARNHPWWGDVVGQHRRVADDLLRRIRDEGPLRSLDMEGEGSRGWWNLKVTRRVAAALWTSGELAIRERRSFQRTFDLTERVIPAAARERPLAEEAALETLLLRALDGHGWATTGTLAATWRLRNMGPALAATLRRLVERGEVMPCALVEEAPGGRGAQRPGRRTAGWIRPRDRELAAQLLTARPRADRPVLLSPFDPLLWDRGRVAALFGFRQVLEIFKREGDREFGYYCLPVLAGESLVARLDLKAERREGRLRVLRCHLEADGARERAAAEAAAAAALARYAAALELLPIGPGTAASGPPAEPPG